MARRGVWAATASEAQNDDEVGTDVDTPADEDADDSLHSDDVPEETEEEESGSEEREPSDAEPAEGEPEGDILALLPEQRERLWAAAAEGDEGAIAERRTWRRLKKQGALTTHGTVASSSEEEQYAEDPVYDLLEGADRVPIPSEEPVAASSRAVESRALIEYTGGGWSRPLQPEPEDSEEDPPEPDTSAQMPPFSEYIPIEEWHPLRFAFDTEDKLVLPPGRAAAMYAFVTQAREAVRQFGIDSAEVKDFVEAKPGSSQRPTINMVALSRHYDPWDPRLQKLYAQTSPTDKSQVVADARNQWRRLLRHHRLRISAQDIWERADTIGIVGGHPRRPIRADFSWPDEIPTRIDLTAPRLPAPPAQPRAPPLPVQRRTPSGVPQDYEGLYAAYCQQRTQLRDYRSRVLVLHAENERLRKRLNTVP
jgi:hypothetical protein